MALVISAGLHLMALAGGAFSILMGGASAREGFAPGRACDVSRISADVTLVDNRVRRNADIAMDLNAIAKGYAADLVAEVLIGAGYQDFLIEMAGDTLACGQRPDGLPWTVALELPIRDRIIPARLIPLVAQNGWQAVATSGGYRRAIGEKSHLMSPISGAALPASAALVAVVAPTTMEADGWATVMAVLGPEAGLKLAARYRLAVAYIERCPPDGFQESGSPAMAALLAAAAAS